MTTTLGIISKPEFDENSRYLLPELNETIRVYARNDDKLADIVASLFKLYSTDPFPLDTILRSPEQLKADLDRMYSLEYLDPDAPPPAPRFECPLPEWDYDQLPPSYRYYGEIRAGFDTTEPFQALIEGTKIQPQNHLNRLRMFSLIKALLFWVYDGPHYEDEPQLVEHEPGEFFTVLSTVVDGEVQYLLVDGNGVPVEEGGEVKTRPLPVVIPEPIPLIDYQMNAIEVQQIRRLYNVSCFEAGIDAHFKHDAGDRPLPWLTFGWIQDVGVPLQTWGVVPMAPVVLAGEASGTLGVDTYQLGGAIGSDGLSTINSVQWTMVSGPAAASFADDTDPKTVVTFPVPGVYVLRLTASNAAGADFDEVEIDYQGTIPVSPASLDPIPHFTTTFINAGGSLLPEINLNTGTGLIEVIGGGNDMDQGNSDQYGLHYVRFEGDGEITIRVLSESSWSSNARIGVTFRESLAHNSRLASIAWRRSNNRIYANTRTSTGSNVSSNNTSNKPLPNVWLRVTRTGDLFRCYYSTDGVTFVQLRSATITGFEKNAYVGIAGDADQTGGGRYGRWTVSEYSSSFNGYAQHTSPKVRAGINQNHIWNEELALYGAIADDGLSSNPLNILWEQVSGPSPANIETPIFTTTLVDGYSSLGLYEFRLTINDQCCAPVFDQVSVNIEAQRDNQVVRYPERYTSGFVKPGAFRYLRDSVQDYGYKIDLDHLIPGSPKALAGVNRRIIMEESTLMLPFGTIRVPACILNWEDLVSDDMFEHDGNLGDTVVFLGIQANVAVERRDQQQQVGCAVPPQVSDSGFKDPNIILLGKDNAPTITNVPLQATLRGPQQRSLKVVGEWGHQHGQLIGYIQTDINQGSQAQYIQVSLNLVPHVFKSRELFDFLRASPVGLPDEITDINDRGTTLDTAPYGTVAITPRLMLDFLTDQSAFPGFDNDQQQAVLKQISPALPNPFTNLHSLTYIVPVGMHLEKNSGEFDFDNLNGSDTDFGDGWSIRRVSSVQSSLSSIFFDNGQESPEDFPPDFVGARLTAYPKDGSEPFESSIIRQIGDKLAQVPEGVVEKLEEGTVVTIDQRGPLNSLNRTYRKEANANSWVDLRCDPMRMVDPVVTHERFGEGGSPSSPSSPASPMSPASPSSPTPPTSPCDGSSIDRINEFIDPMSPNEGWYTLQRVRERSLVQGMLDEVYSSMPTAIESIMRFHLTQRYIQKAADRWDIVDLRSDDIALTGFLVDWVNEFEANKDKQYAINENVLVHWPDKMEELYGERRTVVSLDRYPAKAVLTRKDAIVIQDTGTEWGAVPQLLFHWNVEDHTRYPLRFDENLAFVSEKSFVIPGHTRLAGTFFLEILDTQIPDVDIEFRLERQRESGETEYLGSFELEHQRPGSFKNVDGVFRLDGEAVYNPQTRRLGINYSSTLDFTNEEPGILTVTYSYHDLTQVHPLFRFLPSEFGLQLAHMADAQAFEVQDGKAVAIEVEDPENEGQTKKLVLRLEGLSNNGGEWTVRWNKDDILAALEVSGWIESLWVIRGLPWIEIKSVTYDDFGRAIDVDYEANWISQEPLVSSQIESDDRCQQVYKPCGEKYGWIDITQSNMHTEALPLFDNPRFIFYEKQDFLVDGALDAGRTPKALQQVVSRAVQDYRWTRDFQSTIADISPYETISSVIVVRNQETGERRALSGVYASAEDQGSTVALRDEIDIYTFTDQNILFVRKEEWLTVDWYIEFAGLLVAVKDIALNTEEAHTKLATIGHYYVPYDLEVLTNMTQEFGVDAMVFQVSQTPKEVENWRIGDVPNRYLYRNNNLLQIERQPDRDTVAPPLPPSTPTDYAAMVLSDGPIFYWKLAEPSLPTAVIDSGPNNLDQTYAGLPIVGVPSLITDSVDSGNEAVRFNGTTDCVEIATHPLINDLTVTQRTWELSFKSEDVSGSAIRSIYEIGGSTNGVHIYTQGTTLYFVAFRNAMLGATDWAFCSLAGIAPNATYHVVAIYDGDNGRMRLVVNGAMVDEVTTDVPDNIPNHTDTGAVAATSNSNRIHTGADTTLTGLGNFFQGVVDDVSSYAYAMNVSRAQEHYVEGFIGGGGGTSPWKPDQLGTLLEAWYESEEATTTIPGIYADKSGNNNHATQPTAADRPAYNPISKNLELRGSAAADTNGQFLQVPGSMSVKTVVVILRNTTPAGGIQGILGRPEINGDYIYLFFNQQVGATYSVSFDGTTTNEGRVALNGGAFSAPAGNAGTGAYPTGKSIAVCEYQVQHTNWNTLFAMANSNITNGYRPNADVAAVLLLNGDLDADQKAKVEGWAAHYVLEDTSVLEPGHPYKVVAPTI